MTRACHLIVCLLPILVLLAGCARTARKPLRNPFGLLDVPYPLGRDVQRFAKGVTWTGAAGDPNAEPWAPTVTDGKAGSLDGEWYGRWSPRIGRVLVRTVGDRVYLLHAEDGLNWLIEAERQSDDRLIGRWMQVGTPDDNGPFAGRIVDEERIDGVWHSGRWDFRRRLK
jgi:hypothetical protein